MTTSNDTTQIPYGYCHCGCGNKTNIAKQNEKRRGYIKGQPVKFCHGHFPSRKLSPEQLIISFWSRVNKNGSIPAHMPHLGKCWEWTGTSRDKHGYGDFHGSRSHRVSWELANGTIPNGLWVLHKCDNPKCIRPEHLFLGTPYDNTDDMIKKGRQKRKFSDSEIIAIRKRYIAGENSIRLAKEYGVNQSVISRIINFKIYKYVSETGTNDA